MRINNIIFDFDGTLVDSLQDVSDCLKISFKKQGIQVQSYAPDIIMQMQLKDAIAAIAPGITPEQKDSIINTFREIYDLSDYPQTTLMPTVGELLPELKKLSIGMYIVSNKRRKPTLRILEKFGIQHFFSGIFNPDMYDGTEWMTKKELLAHALEKHVLAKASTVYVGDSEGDIAAARKNGIRVIIVNNGYGTVDSFKIKPDCIIRKISEILTV